MYQQAQKETMYYSYNPQPPQLTPLAGYLGPHEMYPTSFPYPFMYHQPYLKPSYSYPSPMPLREVNKNVMQAPEELDFRKPIAQDSQSKLKVFEKPRTEQFEAWDSSRDLKSIPKFEDLLDIERLERMIYDDVDNNRSNMKANHESLPLDKRSVHLTEERTLPSSARGREMNNAVDKSSLRLEDASSTQVESIYQKKPARLSPNPNGAAQLQAEIFPSKKHVKSSPTLALEREQQDIPRPEPRRRENKEAQAPLQVVSFFSFKDQR